MKPSAYCLLVHCSWLLFDGNRTNYFHMNTNNKAWDCGVYQWPWQCIPLIWWCNTKYFETKTAVLKFYEYIYTFKQRPDEKVETNKNLIQNEQKEIWNGKNHFLLNCLCKVGWFFSSQHWEGVSYDSFRYWKYKYIQMV